MLQPITNISSKYCQKTRYNYVGNSDFFASNCSPLLCYRFVSTTLTAQIPTETLSQSHRLCFIGKERDSETGFSYFGARYYDSDLMTGWLSVDPLADKYPNLSPYAYCAWNPIRLVDPDGRMIGDYYTLNGKFLKSDNTGDGKIYVVKPKNEMSILRGNFDVEKYELPSYEARQQMCNYLELKDNENNLREYGGAIWENETTGSQEIRYAEPGPEWQGGNTDGSVITNNWEKDDGFDAVGKRILTYFHSHFSGNISGDKLEQIPSETDIKNVLSYGTANRFGGARLPYNIVFGMRTREVSLYTEKGVQVTMDLDVFKNIGGNR